jgi:hypothetical protein
MRRRLEDEVRGRQGLDQGLDSDFILNFVGSICVLLSSK